MFVAISYAKMNAVRAEKYASMKAAGYRLVSYVSSRCSYLSLTPPGDNCFILEDNTVQPFVTIGNNVTLWSGNHIGHDATIEDHCFITSHVVVSGYVRVGTRSFIGVNATLRNSITIAPRDAHRRRRGHHEGHHAERRLLAGARQAVREVERRDRPVSPSTRLARSGQGWRRLGRLALDTSARRVGGDARGAAGGRAARRRSVRALSEPARPRRPRAHRPNRADDVGHAAARRRSIRTRSSTSARSAPSTTAA